MNSHDVVNKRTQVCHDGKNLEWIHNLYGHSVYGKELPGVPMLRCLRARACVGEEHKHWLDNIVEFIGGEI